MIRCKIDNWSIRLNTISCKVIKSRNDKVVKECGTRSFSRDGLGVLPKKLYNLICKEVKYANIYDKFLEKFYNWEESE